MDVDTLHRRVEKASHKPRHVLDRAVNQEFFDDRLTRERLTQPKTESYIVLKSLPDYLDEAGDLASCHAALSNCQKESYDELINHDTLVRVHFNLLELLIVITWCQFVKTEDFKGLLHELLVEDVLRQPEATILLLDLMVDFRLDLNSSVVAQFALVEHV